MKIRSMGGALPCSRVLLVTTFLASCASPAEREERRQNAFDLSGQYLVSQDEKSEVPMKFHISNQRSRYDIVVDLERTAEMTDKEMQLLAEEEIPLDLVKEAFLDRSFKLGEGRDMVEGGENISDDFGETSRFFVCSAAFSYVKPEDIKYDISYCLTGTAKRNETEIHGRLSLSVVKVEDDPESTNPEDKRVVPRSVIMNYQTSLDGRFVDQYIGQWSGDVYGAIGDVEGSLNKLATIQIQKAEGQEVLILRPTQVTEILWEDNRYLYDEVESTIMIASIDEEDYPAVHMVFKGTAGARIILAAQIWSLGDLTGSVILIEGDDQTDLASFRMKKD
jgi:hypothetical protein